MAKNKTPSTQAVRLLKQHKVEFTPHPYPYEEKGGTAVCARELGVSEYAVIKTLIMQDETGRPFIVLMHGNQQVSTKQLARQMGVKQVEPCPAKIADKHSGYQVGGTSPFGTRSSMPVYMEKSITTLDRIYINGGKKGFLVGITPQVVLDLLDPTLIEVGIDG